MDQQLIDQTIKLYKQRKTPVLIIRWSHHKDKPFTGYTLEEMKEYVELSEEELFEKYKTYNKSYLITVKRDFTKKLVEIKK